MVLLPIKFVAAFLLLLSCERNATSLTSSKFAFHSRPTAGGSIKGPVKRSISYPKSRGVNNNSQSKYWRASSRLTSSHVEGRYVKKSFPLVSRIQSIIHSGKKWFQKRSSKRLVISVLLSTILVFGPALSPARAATTISNAVATATTTASTSGLAVQNVPFPQSRALGSFNFLPTKAELELAFRLVYSSCTGAFIGLERSSSDRPAGVRTMALVGLGACIFTICSAHGFVPPTALGYAPGSPMLANVKCDLGRMAANVASGVGFIGAGAIHKSKQHGDGTEAQNVVAGLTTAAAIWVSAAVGVASAVGLYFVGAVASLATVGILKFAKVPKEDEPGFSWKPRPLDIVDDHYDRSMGQQDDMSGLFGKNPEWNPVGQTTRGVHAEESRLSDKDYIAKYYNDRPPIVIKEIVDPRFERYLRAQFGGDDDNPDPHQENQKTAKVLIEEEQQVVMSTNNNTDNEDEFPLEP